MIFCANWFEVEIEYMKEIMHLPHNINFHVQYLLVVVSFATYFQTII